MSQARSRPDGVSRRTVTPRAASASRRAAARKLAWATPPHFAARVIRRLSIVLLACLAALLRAEDSDAVVLTADRTEFLAEAGETAMIGRAELRETDLLVTADEFRFKGQASDNPDTIIAAGHVVYTRGPLRILADRVVVNRRARTFSADHVRVGSYPYYVEGESASGARDEVTVFKARITYGEPGPWQPTATADKITLYPGRRLHSEGAQIGIGEARPLPFPRFQQDLSGESFLSSLSLTGGFRGSLGAYADAGLRLPVAPGVRIGGDIGYYTARGVMAGPSAVYVSPTDADRLRGSFRSGYINDHGDRKTDILGRPVPENRGYVEWTHRQVVGDDVTLLGQLNWWKDSEVVRDFRPAAFFPVQQPDTFLEATRAATNSFLSAFARFAPNSFHSVPERLPEIRFDLLPIAVGGGLYERFSAGIAALHEDPLPPGSPNAPFTAGAAHELRSTRFDAYYALLLPIAPRPWLTITPVLGGRLTHYRDTRGAMKDGSYSRALGELGVDAELRASGTFACHNDAWRIDGLRHLVTPRLSYRYIPEAARGRARIPAIDRQTFSTYLQPLGLGDMRNIDDLRATNTLRLGVDNVLQTRDPQHGTRDFLTLDAAADFRFERQRDERDVSEIHLELAAMPARWLEVGTYGSFAPQTFALREFNSGVTIRSGDAWTTRFASSFLRRQLEDYFLEGTVRLNERFDAIARIRYNHRRHRFDEQVYGLMQNLANTWRISYTVSLYSGPRRESRVGFNVQIDTVRF